MISNCDLTYLRTYLYDCQIKITMGYCKSFKMSVDDGIKQYISSIFQSPIHDYPEGENNIFPWVYG